MRQSYQSQSMVKRMTLFICAVLLAGLPLSAGGMVTLNGKNLRDDDGDFLGLGVTFMQALRMEYDQESLLDQELAYLSRQGFNYVRILTMAAAFAFCVNLPMVVFHSSAGVAHGAVGTLSVDTRALEDGLYSIRVKVQDDQGYVNPAIGSRYFHIKNH